MTDKREIGAGDVPLTIDGTETKLTPSLQACLALSRESGGLYGPGSISDRIMRYDFDAFEVVIRAGLGLGSSAVKNLPEQIYRTGLLNLIQPCTKFIAIVANGGQPKTNEEEEEEERRPTSQASPSSTGEETAQAGESA